MKILSVRASLEQQKTVFEAEMTNGLASVKEAVNTLSNQATEKLKNVFATMDDLMGEISELEKQKNSLEHDVREMDGVRKALQQRKEEIELKAKEISELEGELAEERKQIELKKSQLAEKERQLDKQKSFWDERLKNYKIAEPNNG